jgi:hypothetical protein
MSISSIREVVGSTVWLGRGQEIGDVEQTRKLDSFEVKQNVEWRTIIMVERQDLPAGQNHRDDDSR